MQIKEIKLNCMNLDCDCGQFIAKKISHKGKLTLDKCKMTKHEYEALNAELRDKQVRKRRKMFKKSCL